MAAISQIRHHDSEGRAYYEKKIAEGMTGKTALRALKRKISDALYARMIDDARRLAAKDPGGHTGNDSASSAAGSHPETPALRKSHSRATANSKTGTGQRPLRLRPAPDRREPAGAQPGSRWSPAWVRTAGAGRTDLDASEHRPTLAGAGADRLTNHLM
jgi:hypothetical protein